MIRPFQPADLDAVMSLWLEGNLDAHPFIPCAYWEGNLSAVRALLPQAEVLVAVQSGQIQGFIGLDGDDIAGIFVARAARSAGVGSALLGEAKRRRSTLRLHVYRKNQRALAFYRREGFLTESVGTDPATGEEELCLAWLPKAP